MTALRKIIITEVKQDERLDNLALRLFPELSSRSRAKRLIKKGVITYNGEQVSPALYPELGALVELHSAEALPSWKLELEVSYQDEHLAVVYKPPGILTSGNSPRTIRRALGYNLPPPSTVDALLQPEPVHRLDRRAQGLLLVARTTHARKALGSLLEDREIQKWYRAVVTGRVEQPGSSSLPIEGKSARTSWIPLRWSRSIENEWLTEVRVRLETGRRHQIRRHLAAEGHPLLGEDIYIEGKRLRSKGLFLMAEQLTFKHPMTQEELTIKGSPPKKFHAFPERQEQRWIRRLRSQS